MSATTSEVRIASAGEPRPIIPPLASFYVGARDLSWLIVRLTAGGMLLVHGIMKVLPMAEKGFSATIEAFAAGSMARRGIEPALYAAYAVFFLETVGAVHPNIGVATGEDPEVAVEAFEPADALGPIEGKPIAVVRARVTQQ